MYQISKLEVRSVLRIERSLSDSRVLLPESENQKDIRPRSKQRLGPDNDSDIVQLTQVLLNIFRGIVCRAARVIDRV